jgi:hypothetical protein
VLKFNSRPAGYPLSLRYVITCARWTGCGFDGLQFQDEAILDNQIEAKRHGKRPALVTDGHRPILDGAQPLVRQLEEEAVTVDRFEQSRTQGAMDVDGAPDDALAELVQCVIANSHSIRRSTACAGHASDALQADPRNRSQFLHKAIYSERADTPSRAL